MWHIKIIILLLLLFPGLAYASEHDVRYTNPGTIIYDSIKFEVDGQPYTEHPSGCTQDAGVCVATIQLAEGIHTIRAQAWSNNQLMWSSKSNTVTARGVPEPPHSLGLLLGLLFLGAIRR